MTAPAAFDPVAIIAALERHGVDYVLVGGLAQVLRGVDVVTEDVDICPSFARGNLERLSRALSELQRPGAAEVTVGENELARGPVQVQTEHGQLKLVAAPRGVPNGFVALRRAATRERVSSDASTLVASAGDLAAMAGALGRDQDRERLAMLRRIVELEAGRDPGNRPSETVRHAPGRIAPLGAVRRGPRTSR
jgi:hypothetical protein